MADRSHLSIGEVLSLLREEFPDVTISKIRFLESQGLVDPERTPSGYRKFYEHDVERLRWILRQQRENFLPLKVIKGRLTEEGPTAALLSEPELLEPEPATPSAPDPGSEPDRPTPAPAPADGASPGPTDPVGRPGPHTAPLPTDESPPGPTAGREPPPRHARPARPAPTPSIFADLRRTPPDPPVGALEPDDPDTYTSEELAAAAGTTLQLVTDLKQFGLIAPHAVVAGTNYFDPAALAVCRAAAEFAGHGVEVRHLRIWRNAADREADLFQQVVLPLLRQRNPQSRREALDTLSDLARIGSRLRTALVDRALRDIR